MAKGITELISDFKELHPCAYKRIRDNAIDEFAERMKNFMRSNVEDAEYFGDCCCEIYESEIDEIAEMLKGGAK